ncbi:hypothetical protein GGR56DRAFT_688567 [Xylariaceae sp. FL0804]|nr:hypothetical protein GGR56DRAFT_688567 [Xylariaceae sp. FL0804]
MVGSGDNRWPPGAKSPPRRFFDEAAGDEDVNFSMLTRSNSRATSPKPPQPNPHKSEEQKSKKKKSKRVDRTQQRKDCGRMTKRAQRHLGLRQSVGRWSASSEPAVPPASWTVDQPAPFRPRQSVRLVSLDIECWERDGRVVTEVGLAVLDTEDVAGVAPGPGGRAWFPLIRAHHFRVAERLHITNSEFVSGCPDRFEFGSSVVVPQSKLSRAVGAIIGDPDSSDRRPVVLAGHDPRGDLRHLRDGVGYNAWRAPHVADELDTQAMFRRLERRPDGRGLAHVCEALGVVDVIDDVVPGGGVPPGVPSSVPSGVGHYHNAGNDAVYALRALLAMAVRRAVDGPAYLGPSETSTPAENEWSDGDLDDGGPPVRSMEPVESDRGRAQEDRAPRW